MTDEAIIRLYFERNEEALQKTEACYGKYCFSVAMNILASREDAEEIVNDTLVRTWNAIPPEHPKSFRAFLGKIARNLALSRLFRDQREKHNHLPHLVYDELDEIIGDTDGDLADKIALRDSINRFLKAQSAEDRVIFVKRYWYMLPIAMIAKETARSLSAVKTKLHRLREGLREHLLREGMIEGVPHETQS